MNLLTRLYIIILFLLLFSCSSKENVKENTIKCDFPQIVIETDTDTVKIGDMYRAKISLSDTSLLYLNDSRTGERRRTHPVFWINNEIVDSNKDYYIYETVVDSSNVQTFSDSTKFKEWSVELAFPHPTDIGDIRLGQRLSYVIDTQRKIYPNKWNQATGRAKGSISETGKLNTYLDAIQGKIFEIQKEHELKNISLIVFLKTLR